MNLMQLTLLSLLLYLDKPDITTSITDTSVFAVFVGTTPCGPGVRSLHKVSPDAECALIEWKLTLLQHPVTRKPTTFILSSINKFAVAVTNRYSEPGIKNNITGKWSIRENKLKPGSLVYSLEPDQPSLSIHFIKLSDNLIHVLESDGSLMVGNPFWNYTLSREVK